MRNNDILRFLSYVFFPDQCWLWIGRIRPDGYGEIRIQGRGRVLTHRLSYELFCEPIPAGKFICHKCDNRACVNPHHLYAGTQSDNMRDMHQRGRHPNDVKPFEKKCARGHRYSLENTLLKTRPDGRTYRRCKICRLESERHRSKTRKALTKGGSNG